MKIDVALKIIIVLLVVMIIAIAAIILLSNHDKKPTPPTTTPAISSSEPKPSTPPTSSDPDVSTPGSSDPDVSTPDSSDPDVSKPDSSDPNVTEPDVTEPDDPTPPVTDPSGDKAPAGFVFNKTVRSNSGTNLNIRVDIHAEALPDGSVKVTAKMYLEHYSIYLGERKACRFLLDGQGDVFKTEAISLEENVKTSTLLYTFEGELEYGKSLDLYAFYPCNCTYGGVSIESLEISEVIIIK